MPKVSLLVRLEHSYHLRSILNGPFAICDVYCNARFIFTHQRVTAMLIIVMNCSMQLDIMLRKRCLRRLTAAVKDAHTRIRGRGSPCRTATRYVSFVIACLLKKCKDRGRAYFEVTSLLMSSWLSRVWLQVMGEH